MDEEKKNSAGELVTSSDPKDVSSMMEARNSTDPPFRSESIPISNSRKASQDEIDRLDVTNRNSVATAGVEGQIDISPEKVAALPPNEPIKINYVRQAELHSLLISLAIWGLLTRLGINAIGEFVGRSVFSLLLVQVVGCFIMGVSVALKSKLDEVHPLFYLGLTTGYCGSVTTFSSWMVQVFQSFISFPPSNRSRFSNFLDGFNQSYVTFGMCLFALKSGVELGKLFERYIPPPQSNRSFRFPWKKAVSIILVVQGPITWLGSIFLFVYGPRNWRGKVTYSMIISPGGTLMRFYLAKLNLSSNSTRHGFPLGTFLANLIATGLLAALTFLQYTAHAQTRPELCGGIQGLKDGFCGCLSTISTFFLEIFKGRLTSRSTRYFLASWVFAQVLCVLLLGVYVWTHDVGERCAFPK